MGLSKDNNKVATKWVIGCEVIFSNLEIKEGRSS